MPVDRAKETKHTIHRMMVKSGLCDIPKKAAEEIAAEDADFDERDRLEAEQNAKQSGTV